MARVDDKLGWQHFTAARTLISLVLHMALVSIDGGVQSVGLGRAADEEPIDTTNGVG